jgi:hypothetical protein
MTARRPLAGHCAYCGLPTPTPPLCRGHDDLPAGDPLYDLADALIRRLEEVLMAEVDAGGSIIEYDAGDGDYACPECGKRYDTPGLCSGHDEAGHAPVAVEAVGGGKGSGKGPTKPELEAQAAELGIELPAKATKDEIAAAIAEHEAQSAAA